MLRLSPVAVLSLVEIVSWGALYYSFGVVARPMSEDLEASPTTVAGTFSLALLVAGVAAPAVGKAIDRAGARAIIAPGAAVGAAALGLLAAARGPGTLAVAGALLGAAHAGTLYEPAFAGMTRWFHHPAERRRAMLVVTCVAGLASTVFVPLTSALAAMLGWRVAMGSLAVAMALVVVPLAFALPPPSSARATALAVPAVGGLASLRWASAAQSFVSTGTAVHFVTLLRASGASSGEAASLVAIGGAAQVFGRAVIAPLGATRSTRRLGAIAAMQAISLTAIGAGPGLVSILAFVGYGAANGIWTVERASVLAERVDARHYGAASGTIGSYALVARAAAPIALAVVPEHIGAGAAYLVLSGLLLAAAGSLFVASIEPPLRL